MSDVTLPGLIVPVEARIDKLEKALKKAAAAQAKAAQQMEQRAKESADHIGAAYATTGDKITLAFKKLAIPFAGGFAGGIAGGLLSTALSGVSTDVRGLIGEIGDLNDAAGRIGVSTDMLQGLQFGFKQQGIEVNDTTAALEKFVDGIGQAAQGEGALTGC